MSEDIVFRAEGRAFQDGVYDLRALETLVSNYRQIIDNTVPLLFGQRTITDRLRNELGYQVQVRPGSLELLLDFVAEHKAMLAPLSIDGGQSLATAIARLIRRALELRRAFLDLLRSGQRPKIHVDAGTHIDSGVRCEISTGDIVVTDPLVIIAAESTKSAVDRLVRSLNGGDGDISSVTVRCGNEESRLTPQDQGITEIDKDVIPAHVELTGRLDAVSFSSHRGTLVMGDYRYPVVWEELLRPKIHDVVDVEAAVFWARPVVSQRQFRTGMVGFHITDCRRPLVNATADDGY